MSSDRFFLVSWVGRSLGPDMYLHRFWVLDENFSCFRSVPAGLRRVSLWRYTAPSKKRFVGRDTKTKTVYLFHLFISCILQRPAQILERHDTNACAFL